MLLKKSYLTLSLSMALTGCAFSNVAMAINSTPAVQKEKATQTEAFKSVGLDAEELMIKSTDPRYNFSSRIQFLTEKGYIPLSTILISAKERNPYTVEQMVTAYFLANDWKVTKADIASLGKLLSVNLDNDTNLSLDTTKLAYLAKNHLDLLGEFYTTMLLDADVQANPDKGRERVGSVINKAREYFEKQTKSREKTSVDEASELQVLYRGSLSLMAKELQSDLIVQFYLKSILYQDFETQQVTETLLLNHHNPDEIGQVMAAADFIISGMQRGGFAIQINKDHRSQVKADLGGVNTNFVGEYGRILDKDNQEDAALVSFGKVVIEQDKRGLNRFIVKIGNDTYEAKYNLNGRGLDVYTDSRDINSFGYISLDMDNVLTYYRTPNEPKDYEPMFKKGVEYTGSIYSELPKPTHPEKYADNGDPIRMNPLYATGTWFILVPKGYVDDSDIDDAQKAVANNFGYGLPLWNEKCNNDYCPAIKNVTVYSENHDKDQFTSQCSGVVPPNSLPIKLNGDVTGYFLNFYDEDLSEASTAIVFAAPYLDKNDKKDSMCVSITTSKKMNDVNISTKAHIDNIKLSVNYANAMIENFYNPAHTVKYLRDTVKNNQ